MEGIDAVAVEIDGRLRSALPAGSSMPITEAGLRAWVVEYLVRHDDEVARIPDLAGCPHWNLWVRGFDFPEGMFAVVAFWPDRMEFLCGTGNAADIRRSSEEESFDDPTALCETLRARFHVPEEPLRLDRRSAEAWLGRPRLV